MTARTTSVTGRVLTASGLAIVTLAIVFSVKPAWTAEGLKWVGCGISKKAFMSALAAAYEKKTGEKIAVEGGGATRGIVDVASGSADMGGTCRHVLQREEERGVKLVPVGWDALVVMVHPSNTVRSVTLEQLKGIYGGTITNWKELGGADKKIHVLARSGKISGVGRMFRELVFKNPNQEFPSAEIVKESSDVEKTVEQDPGAVGVSGVSSAQKRKIRLLEINGKAPTHENIKDGSYLLYRPLYLVTKLEPSPDVARFVSFALSDEGQALIAGEGTVNLKEGARLWTVYGQQMKAAGVGAGTF